MDETDDIGSNRSTAPDIGTVISRRAALLGGLAALAAREAGASAAGTGLGFTPLAHLMSPEDAVATGHRREVVLRWGDPVLPGAPPFDPLNQTAEAQARQFGTNVDFLALLPAERGGTTGRRALLWANHEYASTSLMFPGLGTGREARSRVTAEQAAVEMAALGGSVVEMEWRGGTWVPDPEGGLNRRITASTPMEIRGPAAGHPRMRTSEDPEGRRVLGMLCNCGGGVTPWGTVLTCEENINVFFGGEAQDEAQREARRRYNIVADPFYAWHRHVARFNLAHEPNEPNRFGWVVEVDPYDPRSTPIKRTALGRFKHEGAASALTPDGRVAIYMGDDERFEYIYRFVSARPFDPAHPDSNRHLLDEGTLSVARFEADGTVHWLPLVHGEGPLTEANGFGSQAEVLIETRRAADLLGATPMDRPEDVEANLASGRVYALLTNNSRRAAERVDPANPRGPNPHGHVIEMVPPGVPERPDHAAPVMRWNLFLRGGRPEAEAGAEYHRAANGEGNWLSCPDNCAFDGKGRIWIATDGAGPAAGMADGLFAAETEGEARALPRLFYRAPIGAEVCGPVIEAGERSILLAVQHPGEASGSSFDRPATRWPDFAEGMPPRASVVVITREDDGPIG
ncbi:PhoX family protein [Sabulicella rubraurantiaca]|uniref:PhoX family protein n=1 Tax=Sabulicella rubraurantiaca TaxID=2811429 RepID=UPI001A9686D1|nr:PhoX family phosphatase [Sabulicella rubraurantiaca]